MKILAIDTSASACSLAVLSDGRIHSSHEVAPMQQASRILPQIEELLQSAGLLLQQLDAIAFGQGPGSFTGLRIAASVTQGLAFALRIPVVPVSSLAVLAQQTAAQSNILTAIDARMGEIYWGAFEMTTAGIVRPMTAEGICRPEGLAVPSAGQWCGIGNAWLVHGNQMGFRPDLVNPESNPDAAAMLPLAENALRLGNIVPATAACPVYLRNNVAFRKSALNSAPSRR